MATRCTECTWAFCKDVQTSSLVLSPGFHIKSSPPRLCARILLLCLLWPLRFSSAPPRENFASLGLKEAYLREIGSEVSAVKRRQGVRLYGRMSGHKEVWQDRGAGAAFGPVIAKDLSGQQGGVLIEIANPEVQRLDRLQAGGIRWEKGTYLPEHDGGDDQAFGPGKVMEQIEP